MNRKNPPNTAFERDAQKPRRPVNSTVGHPLITMDSRILEMAAYVLFAIAALPFAWVGVNDLIYFVANTQALEERDSALEVFRVVMLSRFSLLFLGTACLVSLYPLVAGPNRARVSLLILFGIFAAVVIANPAVPFNSMRRILWDAISMSVLLLTPLVLLAIRFREGKRAPNKPSEGTR